MDEVTFGKHLAKILEKLFEMVGDTFVVDKVTHPRWFLKHSWSKKEQDLFREWMLNYLRENKSAREEILANPNMRSKRVAKAVDFFIMSYGWKLRDD